MPVWIGLCLLQYLQDCHLKVDPDIQSRPSEPENRPKAIQGSLELNEIFIFQDRVSEQIQNYSSLSRSIG